MTVLYADEFPAPLEVERELRATRVPISAARVRPCSHSSASASCTVATASFIAATGAFTR
jgi:hypothetical protein